MPRIIIESDDECEIEINVYDKYCLPDAVLLECLVRCLASQRKRRKDNRTTQKHG